MRMRIAAVTMETCLLIFCTCADNHVALLFINKVGGSRRGLSIQLSGIFTYPACFWNQGVRIIEVLLYSLKSCYSISLTCMLLDNLPFSPIPHRGYYNLLLKFPHPLPPTEVRDALLANTQGLADAIREDIQRGVARRLLEDTHFIREKYPKSCEYFQLPPT